MVFVIIKKSLQLAKERCIECLQNSVEPNDTENYDNFLVQNQEQSFLLSSAIENLEDVISKIESFADKHQEYMDEVISLANEDEGYVILQHNAKKKLAIMRSKLTAALTINQQKKNDTGESFALLFWKIVSVNLRVVRKYFWEILLEKFTDNMISY